LPALDIGHVAVHHVATADDDGAGRQLRQFDRGDRLAQRCDFIDGRAYHDDLFERYQRRQTPAVYAMTLVATVSLALLDWLVVPDVFWQAMLLRSAS
jgi:hypothetical protein